jgi:hypothetical protein
MAVTLHGFGGEDTSEIKNKLLIIVFNFGVLTVPFIVGPECNITNKINMEN